MTFTRLNLILTIGGDMKEEDIKGLEATLERIVTAQLERKHGLTPVPKALGYTIRTFTEKRVPFAPSLRNGRISQPLRRSAK